MTAQADPDEVVEVSRDGVTVHKSFEAEEFPVPAIRFRIVSERDDPVSIRLAEEIPESFPMDGVGFHPDYDSENWTAFQDHHVEYATTIDAGEEVVTVYGIRIDAPEDAAKFLTDPELSSVDSEGGADDPESNSEALSETTIDDITGGDRSQPVKDMLSGEHDGLPGLDEEGDDEPQIELDLGNSTADASTSETPSDLEEDIELDIDADAIDSDADDAGATGDEPSDESASESEAESEAEPVDGEAIEASAATSADAETDAEGVDEGEELSDADVEDELTDADTDVEDESTGIETDESESADGETGAEEGTAVESADAKSPGDSDAGTPVEGDSVVAALAAELRDGSVSERDKRALREALDVETTGPDRAKVEHLQSRVEEIAAYAGALETFLDEEGTGQQLIEDFKADVADLREAVQTLDARVDGQGNDLEDLSDDVESVESTVEDVEASVESLTDDLGMVRTEVESVDERVESVDEQVESVDERVETVEEDVESVETDVSELSDDLQSVEEDVERIQQWREQLGEMFTGE